MTADRGPVQEALEADLRAWGAEDGALSQVARRIASGIDTGALEVTDASRELRQLVKAIREGATSPSEVERFLSEIQWDGFDGRR